MRTSFEKHDRQDLNNWLNETIEKPYGEKVLNQIAWHIQNQIEKNKVDELLKNRKAMKKTKP